MPPARFELIDRSTSTRAVSDTWPLPVTLTPAHSTANWIRFKAEESKGSFFEDDGPSPW